MKIKEGYLLHEIAGNYVVIALLQNAVNMNGLMTVNEIGALLWHKLEEGATLDELVETVLNEYNIDEETAKNDINDFLSELEKNNILER